jgi:hypothetical protein
MLMLPLADRLATLLERLFRSEADELARPQHLDATLAATPALAAAALHEELGRLRGIVVTVAQAALTGPTPVLQRQSDAVRTLVEAIQRFVSSVRAEGTAEDVGAELAGALAAARYLQEAATLAPSGAALRARTASLEDVAIRAALEQFIAEAAQVASLAEATMAEPGDDRDRSAALERLQARYRETKEALLVAAVARRLSVEDTDALLDDLRATRRLVDQLLKADRLLRGPSGRPRSRLASARRRCPQPRDVVGGRSVPSSVAGGPCRVRFESLPDTRLVETHPARTAVGGQLRAARAVYATAASGQFTMRRASFRLTPQAPSIRWGFRVGPAEHVGFREAGPTRNPHPATTTATSRKFTSTETLEPARHRTRRPPDARSPCRLPRARRQSR